MDVFRFFFPLAPNLLQNVGYVYMYMYMYEYEYA